MKIICDCNFDQNFEVEVIEEYSSDVNGYLIEGFEIKCLCGKLITVDRDGIR